MSRIAALIVIVGCIAATAACGKAGNVRRGDRYAAQKKYQEAAIEYRTALQQDPMLAEAHLKLAETYEHLGDVTKAVGEYVRAADLLPGNADVQIKAANFLLLVGEFEDAKARAERVLAATPNNVEAQIAKGNALAGLKNLDAAVAEIEGAIRESPDRGASYADLAGARAGEGKS